MATEKEGDPARPDFITDWSRAEEALRGFVKSGRAFKKSRGGGNTGLNRRNARKGPRLTRSEQALRSGLKGHPTLVQAAVLYLTRKHEEAQKKTKSGQKADFFKSREWLELRYDVLAERGGKCECCGATAKSGAELHIDHILPRSKWPDLALDKGNLQVLCAACNIGKSNRREDDWR